MNASKRTVAAGVPDLFFSAKISETARHLGVQIVFAQTAEALEARVASGVDLVVLDLGAAQLDPVRLIARLKATGTTPVIAFVNHEQNALMDQARAAGCDQVLTRGAFSSGLPAILAGA